VSSLSLALPFASATLVVSVVPVLLVFPASGGGGSAGGRSSRSAAFGRKLLNDAQASTSVPSTEK
jgi:hypothetical protein